MLTAPFWDRVWPVRLVCQCVAYMDRLKSSVVCCEFPVLSYHKSGLLGFCTTNVNAITNLNLNPNLIPKPNPNTDPNPTSYLWTY